MGMNFNIAISDHLRRLYSAPYVNMITFSNSAIKYLKPWYQKLNERNKMVSL